MGAYSRLRYVIAANVNALIEKAEDPEKLLRALIREMEDASEEAREACAELLAEEQHLERRSGDLERQIEQWRERAEKAVAEGRDDLARAALQTRSELSAQRDAAGRERQSISERKAQMERDMETLKAKLAEAKAKLKGYYARPAPIGSGAVGAAPSPTPGERRMKRAMGRFDRLQAQVENLEARVRSYDVGGTSESAWKPEPAPADPRIEEELRSLKASMAGAADGAENEAGKEA